MLGLMGEYMANAPTMGVAVTDIASHQHRYARGTRPYLVVSRDDVVLGYRVHEVGVPAVEQMSDAAIAFGKAIVMELCGEPPIEVMLGHARPVDLQPFKFTFKVPIRFDAEHYGLVYPDSILCQPVPGADPRKRIELNARLEKYWAIEPPDIISSLRRVLAVSLLGGDASLQASASALNMHPRTLNRRLRERGTTFQRELGFVRFSLARQYLESSSIPLTIIASALGYADPSVFTRAFERWSGIAPSQWRLNRANQDHLAP
jgi:AraC-like DNA-binding protein